MSIFDNIGSNKGLGDIFAQLGATLLDETTLKDYAHGSKLMRPDGLALAPNHKFLFHVYFTLNVPPPRPSDPGLVGALVKSIQLPSFNLNTKEYSQYNRKRLLHSKIEYNPVTVKFHDDSSDVIRSLWANYYQYYFADSSYEYDQGPTDNGRTNYNDRDLYDPRRIQQDRGWGITGDSPTGNVKPAYFKDIKIYGMSRGRYHLYTLINPVITSWRHDTYDYAAGNGVMEHEMQVKYEAVKYGQGKIQPGGENVPGFGDPSRYDKTPGALGGSSGGLEGLADDLAGGNLAGGFSTVSNAFKSFSGQDFGDSLKGELSASLIKKGIDELNVRPSNNIASFPKVSDANWLANIDKKSSPSTDKAIPKASDNNQ